MERYPEFESNKHTTLKFGDENCCEEIRKLSGSKAGRRVETRTHVPARGANGMRSFSFCFRVIGLCDGTVRDTRGCPIRALAEKIPGNVLADHHRDGCHDAPGASAGRDAASERRSTP